MIRRPSLLAAAALLPAGACAAELRDIVVDYEDGIYSVESAVWLDAPPDAVYRVFGDWDLYVQFSTAIVEARDIGPDANGERGFYVRNRACLLFFCKSTERTGSVRATYPTLLEASADPARSDFEMSEERWRFEAEDGGTLVHYSLRMRPAFWVPPLIGPYVIKHELRSEGGDAINRIERLAQVQTDDNG